MLRLQPVTCRGIPLVGGREPEWQFPRAQTVAGMEGTLLLVSRLRKLSELFSARLYRLEQQLFDRYLRTSTTGVQLTSHSVFNGGGSNWTYEGCDWLSLYRALRKLRPNSDDVFVDLGSGKGKALLVAGCLPYSKVIGVELDSELATCARQNLNSARSKLKAGLVECEESNVLAWSVPEQASTIFLFNPFFGQTFRSAIEKIFDSYDQNPRRMHILYGYPWEHDWLVSTGRVVVEDVLPSFSWPKRRNWWRSGTVIITYHVVGAGDAVTAGRCLRRPLNPKHKAMLRWSGPNGHPFSVYVPVSSGPVGAVKDGDSVIIK